MWFFFLLEGCNRAEQCGGTSVANIMENHCQLKSPLHMESFISGQSQTTEQKIEQKQTKSGRILPMQCMWPRLAGPLPTYAFTFSSCSFFPFISFSPSVSAAFFQCRLYKYTVSISSYIFACLKYKHECEYFPAGLCKFHLVACSLSSTHRKVWSYNVLVVNSLICSVLLHTIPMYPLSF